MLYRCGDCRKHFSVRKGTVLQSSKLGLQKWAFCLYLVATGIKGTSSMKIYRELGIRQATAWHLEVVKHSVSEYVNGQAHSNGIESFWAGLKRGYHGTFHHMDAKHLHRYVNEVAGRHNLREFDTIEIMSSIAKGLEGKRLTYRELVK